MKLFVQFLESEIAKFKNKEFMKDKKERKEFIAHPINKALSKVQTVSSSREKKNGLEAQN